MKARMIRWTVMAAPWSHIWLCLRWLPKGQNHQNPLQGPALATGDLMGSSAGKNSIRTMTAGFRAQSGRATSKVSTGWMPIRMGSSPKKNCDRQPGSFIKSTVVDCSKWTQTRMEASREANGRAKKRSSTGWMPTKMGCSLAMNCGKPEGRTDRVRPVQTKGIRRHFEAREQGDGHGSFEASVGPAGRKFSKGVRNDRETRRLGYGLLRSAPVIDHCNLLDARNRAVGRARFWR